MLTRDVSGTNVGRYEILGQLAIGGMAEILLARVVGPGGFERPVVIKRILPHLARQRGFVDMFLDEARIVASIRHHNVVHVQELVHEDGELLLVMEYLEGESVAGLTRRLFVRDETLDPSIAIHIVAEACAGLHASHELTDANGAKQNLVHRDVSPQNVMLTYDGQVKILDFGIAKASGGMAQTEAGQIKGKFQYMSPEQCRNEPLDRRSDVFSAGIMLYELTTGRRLFKCSNPVEAIRAICADAVLPPSRLVVDYPPALEGICLRALSASRDERYQTMADMRRALLSALPAPSSGVPPAEALSGLMRSVFADRVAEKAVLLRRVRAGSNVTNIPAGEVDEAVEPPGIAMQDTVRDVVGGVGGEAGGHAASRLGARPVVRWGSRVLIGAAMVAFVAVGAAIPRRTSRDAPVPVPSGAAATEAPVVSGVVPLPPPAGEVIVHVETHPTGARVSLDGSERGSTPLDLHLSRGNAPLTIDLRRSGYSDARQSIVPDADQKILLELEPRTVRRAGAATDSRPAPIASSPWARWN